MQHSAFTRNKTATPWSVLGVCLLIMTLQAAVGAQTRTYPCEPTSAVKQALEKLSFDEDAPMTTQQRREHMLAPLRSLQDQFPNDFFVHRRYQDFVKFRMADELDSAIEQYRARAENHPNDPMRQYLYGRVLIGRRTQEAISLMQKVLRQVPDFPWAHWSLVSIYQMPAYRDKEKARTHLKTFMELCPTYLEAYSSLRSIDDPELQKKGAGRLRARLEQETDPEALSHYRTLWTLEFRITPASEHARLRKRVEEDLGRLRRLDLVKNKDCLHTLSEGYKLTNDTEGLRWVEGQLLQHFPQSSTTLHYVVYDRWDADHPRPGEKDPPEKVQAYYRALYEATGRWVRQWPDRLSPWQQRISALQRLEDVSTAEVEAALDGLLGASEKGDDTFYAVPPVLVQAAQLCVKRKVRLERVPELVRKGFQEIERRTQRDMQSDWYTPEMRESLPGNLEYSYWTGWPVLVDAYLKTNQRDKAREVLSDMEAALAKQKPEESAEAGKKRTYARHQATYWEWMGRLAEADGRRLDALAFYQNALMLRPKPDEKTEQDPKEDLAAKAQQLWKELGGTKEGWQAWSSRAETAMKPTEALAGMPWEKREKTLPDFELSDMQGRTWRLTAFKGKVAFINIWATWCGPCREELPYVQKLYDRLKDRPDALLLTLNVDDNVGLVEPYLKKQGFTFPVLPASAYVERVLSHISIPRNWIVGPNGLMQMEQVGFGGHGDQWLEQALQMLEKARGSG